MSAISDICAQASLVVLFKDHSILGYEKRSHTSSMYFSIIIKIQGGKNKTVLGTTYVTINTSGQHNAGIETWMYLLFFSTLSKSTINKSNTGWLLKNGPLKCDCRLNLEFLFQILLEQWWFLTFIDMIISSNYIR